MDTVFCNLKLLKWLTGDPLFPTRLTEQRTQQSHKVGQEEEDFSSNAYTDQSFIKKWIGGGE
jgi:hypothetical protein